MPDAIVFAEVVSVVAPEDDDGLLGQPEILDRLDQAAGIAFGVDRLVMLLTGARVIDDVIAFPPEEL